MNESTKSGSSRSKRLIVWIVDAVVAVLCILAIVCYFFGPVWQINLTYTITADQFQEWVGSDLNVDVHDVIGEEGEKISLSLSLTAGNIFGAMGSVEGTVDEIVDTNADTISAQLSKDLNGLAKKTVKSAAKNTVKDEVKGNIQRFLSKDDGSGVTEEEVERKLDELGFTDDYISEKTDKLIDEVFDGGSDIDSVTESIMDTVDEVYADLQKNAEGKEGYEDFLDVELTEEDKSQIEDAVRDTLKDLANEDGSIDPDELIAELLAKALGGQSDDDKDEEPQGVAMLAETRDAGGSSDKLAAAIKDKVNGILNDDVRTYASIVFYVMLGTMIFSMLPWAYVLIKLIVKAAGQAQDPTVKLALPIWLGWLFFLIFAAIPTVALWVLRLPSVMSMLSSISALQGIVGSIEQVSFSVTSLSWISALCALLAFGISIYFMVARRQLKKEAYAPIVSEPRDEHEEREERDEPVRNDGSDGAEEEKDEHDGHSDAQDEARDEAAVTSED